MKLQITRGSCLTHSCNEHLLSPCYILGSVLSVWFAERNTTISLPSWSLHSSWRGTDNKNLNNGQGNCKFLKSHSSGYLSFLLFGNINSLSLVCGLVWLSAKGSCLFLPTKCMWPTKSKVLNHSESLSWYLKGQMSILWTCDLFLKKRQPLISWSSHK